MRGRFPAWVPRLIMIAGAAVAAVMFAFAAMTQRQEPRAALAPTPTPTVPASTPSEYPPPVTALLPGFQTATAVRATVRPPGTPTPSATATRVLPPAAPIAGATLFSQDTGTKLDAVAISPDGSRLAYLIRHQSGPLASGRFSDPYVAPGVPSTPLPPVEVQRLRIVRADGIVIRDQQGVTYSKIAWSPDGNYLAYWPSQQSTVPVILGLMSPDGVPVRAIPVNVPFGRMVDYAWAPDSRSIAVSVYEGLEVMPARPRTAVIRVDLATNRSTTIAVLQEQEWLYGAGFAGWTASGNAILLTAIEGGSCWTRMLFLDGRVTRPGFAACPILPWLNGKTVVTQGFDFPPSANGNPEFGIYVDTALATDPRRVWLAADFGPPGPFDPWPYATPLSWLNDEEILVTTLRDAAPIGPGTPQPYPPRRITEVYQANITTGAITPTLTLTHSGFAASPIGLLQSQVTTPTGAWSVFVAGDGQGHYWFWRAHIPPDGALLQVRFTDSCLNVRAEPGLSAAVLACPVDGTLVFDIGETREADGQTWRRIRTPADVEGWVSAGYVAP